LIDDDKPASYYIGKLKKEADRINDLSIPYNPLTTNSNAAASEMLKGAGIPLPPPKRCLGGYRDGEENYLHSKIIMRMNQRVGREFLHSPGVRKTKAFLITLAIIGYLSFLLGGLLVWRVIMTPTNPMTAEELRQRIERECPVGSSRAQAVAFLDKYCTFHDGHRNLRSSEIGGLFGIQNVGICL
jgi:hypothetical protein